MNKSIDDLVKASHTNAVNKEWWGEERSFGETIVLIHSEASEALEDYRNGRKPTEQWYEYKYNEVGEIFDGLDVFAYRDGVNRAVNSKGANGILGKPCGIPSELADIVIRVMDACGRYGIDLERAITEKMAYNATRPRRHGGKVL